MEGQSRVNGGQQDTGVREAALKASMDVGLISLGVGYHEQLAEVMLNR